MKPFPSYRIILAILLSLLFFTSFAMSERLMDGLSSAKMFYFSGVSIVVLFTVSLGLLFARKPLTVRLHWLDVSILAFWGYNCIRLAFTPYVSFDNKRFIVLTLLTLLFFVFKWVLQQDDQEKGWTVERKIVITGFLLSGLLQSLFCILQLYDINPWYSSNYFKVVGTFGNPDAVAGYLATVIPFAFGVWQLTPKDEAEVRWIRMLGMITFLAGIFVLPGTLIRGAWLAVTVGTGFCLVYKYRLWVKLRELFITKWRMLAGAFIALLLFSVVMVGLYRLKPDSAYGRLLIWKVTLGMIADAPVFGIGFDRFRVDYGNVQAAYFESGRGNAREERVAGNVHHAHNEILQSLAEGGTIGVLVHIFGLLILFRGIRQRNITRKNDEDETRNVFFVPGCASVIALFISSFFSFPLQILQTQVNALCLLLLLSLVGKYESVFNLNLGHSRRRQFALLLTVTMFLAALSLFDSSQAYGRWNDALAKAQTEDYEGAVIQYELLKDHFAHEGKFLFMFGATLGLAGEPGRAISLLEEAKKRFNDPNLWVALGQNYEVVGEYASAERHYAHAANIVPHKLYPQYLLAKLYQKTGKQEDAHRLAEEIVRAEEKTGTAAAREMKAEMRAYLQWAGIK
jgi:O-antigen ligase